MKTLNLYVVVFDWSIDWHIGEDEEFVDMINHVKGCVSLNFFNVWEADLC